MSSSETNAKIIVIGGGGHARVLVDALTLLNAEIEGYTDIDESVLTELGVTYLGDDKKIYQYDIAEVRLVNAIGSVGDNRKRGEIYNNFVNAGYTFLNVFHPSGHISSDSETGNGIQLMAGAVVQAGCVLKNNIIVNSNACVDHDCNIADHVHIASGATLCGGVNVGELSHIGAGSTVIQGINIGKNVIIGAGAVVVSDVEDNLKMVGVPARPV